MTKRDLVLQLAETGKPGPSTPAAFFLHFPPESRRGQAAVQKHVEYFRATGNDIMKIQYEHKYPRRPELVRPSDWQLIPCYGEEFYADQFDVVAGIVDALKSEAVVVVTLYSAFMFASQLVGKELLVRHLEEDPDAVGKGLEIITESMLTFIRGCIARGVDGFYASTQGGELGRFTDPSIFDRFVQPHEMRIWREIDSKTALNILHVCDYELPYDSLNRYIDYPGQIVSAPLSLTGGRVNGAGIARMFGRPFLGGMERLGPLSTGPAESVIEEAEAALRDGPPAMILGADCTLDAEAKWSNIAAATSVAHGHAPARPGV
jgi:uroporphyrinogen decarboxylase